MSITLTLTNITRVKQFFKKKRKEKKKEKQICWTGEEKLKKGREKFQNLCLFICIFNPLVSEKPEEKKKKKKKWACEDSVAGGSGEEKKR